MGTAARRAARATLRPHGPPATTLDFSGSALVAGASLTRTGSGVAVKTGDATWQLAAAGGFTADNTPRFGKGTDAAETGVLVEEARTGLSLRSRDVSVAPWSGAGVTPTYNAAPGADGTANSASRLVVTSAQFGRFQFAPALTNGASYCWSVWTRANADGDSWQIAITNGAVGVGKAVGGTQTTAFRQRTVTFVAGTDTQGDTSTVVLIPTCGLNGTSGITGGVAAGARDQWVDDAWLEPGKFPGSPLVMAGAQVTRNQELLALDAARAAPFASGGRLRFYAKCYPLGASTEYAADALLYQDPAGNEVRWLATYQQLQIKTAGGGVYTGGGVPAWARDDSLEVWAEGGTGGGVRLTCSINGGSQYLLSLGGAVTLAAAATPSSANLLCSSTGAQLSGRLVRASNVQPAWAKFSATPDWRTSLDGWNDTGRATRQSGYVTPHGWASVDQLTDAQHATLEFFCDDSAPGYEAAIEVQDVASNTWVRVLATTNNALNQIAVALPGAGLRRIRIYTGTRRAALGSWPTRMVSHDGTLWTVLPSATAPACRLVVIGDSIPSEGFTPMVVARDNTIGQLRALLANTRVTYVGTGGDALSGHYQSLNAFWGELHNAVGDVQPGGRTVIWWHLNYNDYNSGWDTAAHYNAALTSAATGLSSNFPGADLYFANVGPTTNTAAGTTSRDIATQAAWNTNFANVINGLALARSTVVDLSSAYTTAQTGDGVHLIATGAAALAAFMKLTTGVT